MYLSFDRVVLLALEHFVTFRVVLLEYSVTIAITITNRLRQKHEQIRTLLLL